MVPFRVLPARAWPGVLIRVALCLAFAVRLAQALPAHRYPAEADCDLSALTAFEILDGAKPVFFPGGVRLGASGCYLTALLFVVLGATKTALAMGPVLVGGGVCWLWFRFARDLLGDERLTLVAALFIVLPAPAFGFWSYMPNSYPEVVLACVAVLASVASADRHGLSAGRVFVFGLAAGFGWWSSIQTLTCTLPALVWLGWRRPRLWQSPRLVASAVAGAFVGASPWLAYNLVHPLASFRNNYGMTRAPGLRAVLSNASDALTVQVPELLASRVVPAIDGVPDVVRPLGVVVLAVIVGAAFLVAWQAWRRPETLPRPHRAAAGLLLLTTLAILGAYAISGAASTHGTLGVRYVLPLYLPIPILFALAWQALRGRAKWFAAVLGGVVLTYYAAGARLPGTKYRQDMAAALARDEALVRSLAAERVEAVAGPYWDAYPINFLTRRAIPAVALEPAYDFLSVAWRLGDQPRRWALVAADPALLRRGLDGTPLAGTLRDVGGLWFGVVAEPQAAGPFLERVRMASRRAERSYDARPPESR